MGFNSGACRQALTEFGVGVTAEPARGGPIHQPAIGATLAERFRARRSGDMRCLFLSIVLILAAACAEDVTAPGLCPDFCPSTRIGVVDTVVLGAIVRDSSFRGYVAPHNATNMQVTVGGELVSHAVIRFADFSDSVQLGSDAANRRAVVAVDSFRVQLTLANRSADLGEFELVFHRLPASVDTLTPYSDLDPYFRDSTEVGVALVPDSITTGEVSGTLHAGAFPTLASDSSVAAIGVSLRAARPGFANLKSSNAGSANVRITRYVQVDSAGGQLVGRSDTTNADMDTFVFPPFPDAGAATLAVGGAPSARALLRVDSLRLRSIIDSSSVVRATLLIVPAEPIRGAPGDTLRILAEAMAADFGPKSPIITVASDSIWFASALVTVGSTDTVRVDVTHIIAPWRLNKQLPWAFVLRALEEGTTPAELRLGSSASASGAPALHITYVPPVVIGRQ